MNEQNVFDDAQRPDFMDPHSRRVIADHLFTLLKYPVKFEGQTPEGEWNVFFTANTPADVEFRLQNYGLGNDYVAMRAISNDGKIFHHTMEDIIAVEQKAEQRAIRQTAPMRKFINSPPLDALKTATEIMVAAEASQHFAIPHRAVVLLNHPALHRIVFVEFDDSVACRLFVTDAQYESELTVTIWKRHHPNISEQMNQYKLPDDFPMFAMTPKKIPPSIQAFLFLLCASIVRDFWVLNEITRGRTYRKEKNRQRIGRGKKRKLEKTYIFIPRFKYNLDVYDTKDKKAVEHSVREKLSPAFVSGHIRRLPEGWKTSDTAKENATEFGITSLAPGTTFVQPHERGEIHRLRVYRSESALRQLFGTESNDETQTDQQ